MQIDENPRRSKKFGTLRLWGALNHGLLGWKPGPFIVGSDFTTVVRVAATMKPKINYQYWGRPTSVPPAGGVGGPVEAFSRQRLTFG